MTFVVTRTSESTTPQIKTFNTLQELIKLHEQEKHGILIIDNFWYNETVEECMECCQVPKNLAKQIVSTKYEIEIYDDYRE